MLVRILLVLALLAPLAAPAARAETRLGCQVLPQLVRTYLRNHVSHPELSEEIQQRTVETYVEHLDPSHTLWTESEAAQLQQELGGIFDDVQLGHCSKLTALHQKLLARYQEVEGFVRGFVGGEDYALDREVTLVLDPDVRGWPKTKEERQALYKKLVHFQISNYLAEGNDLAESRKRLIHRYELMTRRASEQTPEDIYASFLDVFARSLDPHSQYFSADALEDFQIGMSLSLEGIGVALSSRDGYAVVEKIIPGGAAARLNVLRPKDRIITVREEGGDTVDIVDMALRDVVRLIRGKRGTPVYLTLLRQGEKTERIPVTIVRDKIELEEQAAKLEFVEHQVGGRKLKLAVLDLPSFYGDSDPNARDAAKDVAQLLAQAREAKADGLVLDLSHNAGGHLQHAVTISGFFIRSGGVVAVRDSDSRVQVHRDEDDAILWAGPMVVLTSRVSASASEILVGALKDYGRAVIVGDDHTFGKGTVQSVNTLPPGLGALKITTALFFRPGGASTQHRGVQANIVLPSLLDGEEIGERYQPYSLDPESIPPFLSAADARGPGRGSFEPIEPEVLAELTRRSEARTRTDSDFEKIREALAKGDENDGVIRIADLLDEQTTSDTGPSSASGQSAAANGATAPSDEEETGPSPQLREALSVLEDLVVLRREHQV